jgi:hypothetical protein
MTSASGRNDSAAQNTIAAGDALRVVSGDCVRAAAIPTTMCPRLAIA